MTTQTANRFSQISIAQYINDEFGEDPLDSGLFKTYYSQDRINSSEEYSELFQTGNHFERCTFENLRFGNYEWRKSTFAACTFINCTFFEGYPNSFDGSKEFINCTFNCYYEDMHYSLVMDYRLNIDEIQKLQMKIGCQERSIAEWKIFFHPASTEVINTSRDRNRFSEIKEAFKSFLEFLGGKNLVGSGWY